jgi:hypothetical protein
MKKKKYAEKFKEYHFEFRHITVLFIILFAFQLLVSFINKSSIKSFLSSTQEWYQKDSAEELANLTTTSLELLLESLNPNRDLSEEDSRRITQSFDIIFSQQILQHNLEEICVIVKKGNTHYAIDEGKTLYGFLFAKEFIPPATKMSHARAIDLYSSISGEISGKEQIQSILTGTQTFNVFVPFVLRGEYIGAVYMKITPDFSFITDQVISSYDETSVIYLSLILLGLLTMYFISSYTVKERDDAQKLLFEEHETNLKKQITYQKEILFTKRIYHTHHKAEKVMGFIKEDLRLLESDNIVEIKNRVTKYSNFISRVIYDMKWFDPPIQTIRNQIFQTNLNDVIRFIVDHIFMRLSTNIHAYKIIFEPDEHLPRVPVNEFVVWEIIEPIIQNSIDHAGEKDLIINITTRFDPEKNESIITIRDTGKGILPEMLEKNSDGVKILFQDDVSSKKSGLQNSGYGCYIAYEMSRRCGWEIDAVNVPDGGCAFSLKIIN